MNAWFLFKLLSIRSIMQFYLKLTVQLAGLKHNYSNFSLFPFAWKLHTSFTLPSSSLVLHTQLIKNINRKDFSCEKIIILSYSLLFQSFFTQNILTQGSSGYMICSIVNFLFRNIFLITFARAPLCFMPVHGYFLFVQIIIFFWLKGIPLYYL